MRLSDEDREALGDWWEVGAEFDADWNVSTLAPVVAAIVARHVTAALNEAAMFIRGTAGIGAIGNDYASGWYAALDYAIGELQNRANSGP